MVLRFRREGEAREDFCVRVLGEDGEAAGGELQNVGFHHWISDEGGVVLEGEQNDALQLGGCLRTEFLKAGGAHLE